MNSRKFKDHTKKIIVDSLVRTALILLATFIVYLLNKNTGADSFLRSDLFVTLLFASLLIFFIIQKARNREPLLESAVEAAECSGYFVYTPDKPVSSVLVKLQILADLKIFRCKGSEKIKLSIKEDSENVYFYINFEAVTLDNLSIEKMDNPFISCFDTVKYNSAEFEKQVKKYFKTGKSGFTDNTLMFIFETLKRFLPEYIIIKNGRLEFLVLLEKASCSMDSMLNLINLLADEVRYIEEKFT